MTREWKPGDVAVGAHPHGDGLVRGIIDTDGRFYTTDRSVAGISSSAFALSSLRPLAVIDPENREQVERLASDFMAHDDPLMDPTRSMQAALRGFANPKPPKTDEPTGLGAVVEDERGRRFVRIDPEDKRFPWVNARKPGVNAYNWTDFGGLDGAERLTVISEGVQP